MTAVARGFSRRAFVRTSACAAAGVLTGAARGGSALTFHCEKGFPLLVSGEAVTVSHDIVDIATFAPLFGAQRAVVNPATPRVSGKRSLEFVEPGEYYLVVNRVSYLKTVVFSPAETMTQAVLRLFDFCVANNLYLSAQDHLWRANRESFLQRFFASREPMMLSCAPTHTMFRLLVERYFGLPARIASGIGAFYQGDQLVTRAHNVPEVYLPEAGKFVFMDLNNGFVPLWLDGLEVAERTRVWKDRASPGESFEDLGFEVHAPVRTHHVSELASRVMVAGQGRSLQYSPALMAGEPLGGQGRAYWMRSFYSGIGYWGGTARWVSPSGTGFLPGDYNTASLHADPRLAGAVKEWLERYEFGLIVHEPAALRRQLEQGHRAEIASRQWEKKFPSARRAQ